MIEYSLFEEVQVIISQAHSYLQDLNIASIFLRISLATLCGGILGFDRGKKKRPAGIKTYTLVCIGAALTMMTNQYIVKEFGGDPSRLGAQVISGIGFLGAGTIMVTGKNKVKGLTTAAGLWATATMGIAIGIGFYIGAIVGCIYIFIAMASLRTFEENISAKAQVIDIYIEFVGGHDLGYFIEKTKQCHFKISAMELVEIHSEVASIGSIMSISRLNGKEHGEILNILREIRGVYKVEEIGI